jgi:hypothetical protein
MNSIVHDIIKQIAKNKLGIDTLQVQGVDRLDFHEVNVVSLREALLDAIETGYKLCEQARG